MPSPSPGPALAAEPGIRVEGLTKRFPRSRDLLHALRRPFRRDDVTALDGVDLLLEPGRVHGLVGPNGAGKTTLLKALAGLILPDEGRIRIAGLDPERDAERVRALVGYVVADERSFFWRLSVRENLRFFATLRGLGPAQSAPRIEACLRMVRLEARAGTTFQELSSGMRQRLAIARALLSDPPILLLDEPTRSLDPQASASVRRLVRGLMGAGSEPREPARLILCSSHDLGEIEEICSRVILMRAGRIVAQHDIGAAGQYVFQTRQVVPEELRAELGDLEPLDASGTRFALRTSAPEEVDRLVDGLRRRNIGLRLLQPGSRPLQGLFDGEEEP